MLYSLERDGGGPFSGLVADDSHPAHRDCGGFLREVGGPIWNCTKCDESGCLQVRRAFPELIARRWEVLPAQPEFAAPPSDTRDWGDYLHKCFPNGALIMVAEDAPGYAIREENHLVLSHVVDVAQVDERSVVVSVWDTPIQRNILLSDTVRVEPIRPGVIVLANRAGKHVRLDSHLTEPEIAMLRDEDYSMTPEQVAQAAYLRGEGPDSYISQRTEGRNVPRPRKSNADRSSDERTK